MQDPISANDPKRAIILAAGRGRRLKPHTDHTPKPLLPVDGRPLLDTILDAMAPAGVQDVCLVTHYLAEQIEAHVGDGSAWGLRATYRRQPEMRGTAHALRCAADFLTAPSFVLAADYILPRSFLANLKDAYLDAGASLAVSLKTLPAGELSARSSVRFDDQGRITAIVEKPDPGTAPSQTGASLVFIVPPAIRHYLQDLALSPRDEYELQAVVNQMLDDGYRMAGLLQPTPREWTPDHAS